MPREGFIGLLVILEILESLTTLLVNLAKKNSVSSAKRRWFI